MSSLDWCVNLCSNHTHSSNLHLNCIKADIHFVILLSESTGNRNWHGCHQNEPQFCEQLLRRSSKVFHHPVFCTVLHNLCERKLMVRSAFSKVPMSLKQEIENLCEEDLNNSFNQFLTGKIANNPCGQFLNKIKTVCASMGHTGAAAKATQCKSFAMMLKFGLPAVMFTQSL